MGTEMHVENHTYVLYFMCTIQTGGPDFILEGMQARNRALVNDVVVVKLIEDRNDMAQVHMQHDYNIYTYTLYMHNIHRCQEYINILHIGVSYVFGHMQIAISC